MGRESPAGGSTLLSLLVTMTIILPCSPQTAPLVHPLITHHPITLVPLLPFPTWQMAKFTVLRSSTGHKHHPTQRPSRRTVVKDTLLVSPLMETARTILEPRMLHSATLPQIIAFPSVLQVPLEPLPSLLMT